MKYTKSKLFKFKTIARTDVKTLKQLETFCTLWNRKYSNKRTLADFILKDRGEYTKRAFLFAFYKMKNQKFVKMTKEGTPVLIVPYGFIKTYISAYSREDYASICTLAILENVNEFESCKNDDDYYLLLKKVVKIIRKECMQALNYKKDIVFLPNFKELKSFDNGGLDNLLFKLYLDNLLEILTKKQQLELLNLVYGDSTSARHFKEIKNKLKKHKKI